MTASAAVRWVVACAGLLLVTVLAVRWSAWVRDLDMRLFDALNGAVADGPPMRLVAGIADPSRSP